MIDLTDQTLHHQNHLNTLQKIGTKRNLKLLEPS